MADNYIEKRMEDLRRGASRSYRPKLTPAGAATGKLVYRFPPRRVLVACEAPEATAHLVRAFSAAGCRTAFLGQDSVEGERLASASGSRFIPGAVAPVVDREVSALLHKWGDLDILAGDAGLVRPVAALVAIHRKSLLMPNCYGRLLLVGEGDETLCSEMRAVHFTANVIHPSEAGIWADVARTAVWLCLDENRCFDGQAFRLV